jgi:hypothetical protein
MWGTDIDVTVICPDTKILKMKETRGKNGLIKHSPSSVDIYKQILI